VFIDFVLGAPGFFSDVSIPAHLRTAIEFAPLAQIAALSQLSVCRKSGIVFNRIAIATIASAIVILLYVNCHVMRGPRSEWNDVVWSVFFCSLAANTGGIAVILSFRLTYCAVGLQFC
jgi:hypothetical protein